MRELTLIRHAKSDWNHPLLADADRPLNQRGERDAPFMGSFLAGEGLAPDALVTSPARRAIQTARLIAPALGVKAKEILQDPQVYHADVADILAVIQRFKVAWHSVVLVGHNPGLLDTAEALCETEIDRLPTCGVIRIRFDETTWANIRAGQGQLIGTLFPKELRARH